MSKLIAANILDKAEALILKKALVTPGIFYTIFEEYDEGVFPHLGEFQNIYVDDGDDKQFLRLVKELNLTSEWKEFVVDVLEACPEYAQDLDEEIYSETMQTLADEMIGDCKHGNIFVIYKDGENEPFDMILMEHPRFIERAEIYIGSGIYTWTCKRLEEGSYRFRIDRTDDAEYIFQRLTDYIDSLKLPPPLTHARVDLDLQVAKNAVSASMLVDWTRENLLSEELRETENVFAEEANTIGQKEEIQLAIHCARYATLVGPDG